MRLPVVLVLTLISFTASAQLPPGAVVTGLAPGQAYVFCMRNVQVEIDRLKAQSADADYINRLANNATAACTAAESRR
jgi:hypothetical protein